MSDDDLPAIPAKRYFTIGEVGELCSVKPHVLRYWEQEFTQLRPMKRQGNRRYYQHHEVLMIRRIRALLYDQGYSIHGARQQLMQSSARTRHAGAPAGQDGSTPQSWDATPESPREAELIGWIGSELRQIRELLTPPS